MPYNKVQTNSSLHFHTNIKMYIIIISLCAHAKGSIMDRDAKKETSRICKNECITKRSKTTKTLNLQKISTMTHPIISSRSSCSISFTDTNSAGILHADSHPCRRSRFFEAQSDHFHDHPSRRPWHDSSPHRWYSDPGRLLAPR